MYIILYQHETSPNQTVKESRIPTYLQQLNF